jgi:ribosome-associated heat shock protein Hsp15
MRYRPAMAKADRKAGAVAAAQSSHVRFDKWLWAARFYRTRNLAALAIDAGQARHTGERVKVAHPVRVGDTITIRKQGIVWEVTVTALSPRGAGPPETAHLQSASGGSAAAARASMGPHIRRGSAADAATLYRESAASAKAREEELLRRRAADAVQPRFSGRPTKRQRRKLEDFLNEP